MKIARPLKLKIIKRKTGVMVIDHISLTIEGIRATLHKIVDQLNNSSKADARYEIKPNSTCSFTLLCASKTIVSINLILKNRKRFVRMIVHNLHALKHLEGKPTGIRIKSELEKCAISYGLNQVQFKVAKFSDKK